MRYNITYEKDGIYQSILVEAPVDEVAVDYLRLRKPDVKVLGVWEARPDDEKPGKPILVVPKARWKGAGFGDYRCSLCDEETSGTPDFCPHCHAYMG